MGQTHWQSGELGDRYWNGLVPCLRPQGIAVLGYVIWYLIWTFCPMGLNCRAFKLGLQPIISRVWALICPCQVFFVLVQFWSFLGLLSTLLVFGMCWHPKYLSHGRHATRGSTTIKWHRDLNKLDMGWPKKCRMGWVNEIRHLVPLIGAKGWMKWVKVAETNFKLGW